MSTHYFREPKRPVRKFLISDFIRGVSVEFMVAEGLFSYRRVDPGTKLLIESAVVREGDVVLDLGCGYGAIGITIAKAVRGVKVYMVDINKLAVELAKENVKRNGVADRVKVFHGDLYEPIKGLVFNVILTNPPIAAGLGIIERIVTEAPKHLVSGGSLQMVLRKGENVIKDLMTKHFKNVKVLARKSGYTVLMGVKD